MPLFSVLKRRIESHPHLWRLAWHVLNISASVFPHDPSYRAARHFRIPPGALILDVGANSGISARYFLNQYPHAKIVSVEPNPLHAPELEKLKRKSARFDFQLVGLGGNESRMTLYTPVHGAVVLHTFSSLDRDKLVAALEMSYPRSTLKKIQIVQQECRITTLDALACDPYFIKIDAEGFEVPVLQGGLRTLKRARPILLFEAQHANINEIMAIIAALDYILLAYDAGTDRFTRIFDGMLGAIPEQDQRNLVAAPSEHVRLLGLTGTPR